MIANETYINTTQRIRMTTTRVTNGCFVIAKKTITN